MYLDLQNFFDESAKHDVQPEEAVSVVYAIFRGIAIVKTPLSTNTIAQMNIRFLYMIVINISKN